MQGVSLDSLIETDQGYTAVGGSRLELVLEVTRGHSRDRPDFVHFYYCAFEDHGTNPVNPNAIPNPYEIPVEVSDNNGIAGGK